MVIFWANDTSASEIVIDFWRMCLRRHSRKIAEPAAIMPPDTARRAGLRYGVFERNDGCWRDENAKSRRKNSSRKESIRRI
jgi:hypothetical protein